MHSVLRRLICSRLRQWLGPPLDFHFRRLPLRGRPTKNSRSPGSVRAAREAGTSAIAQREHRRLVRRGRHPLRSPGEAFLKAKRFHDFRKMFDEMGKQIDAVVVGTPDHTHAPAAAMAMRLGKHCYCEKPLTHTVYEARVLATIAREQKLVTQMGTQIHAGDNYRRVVELIQAGAIGPVRNVHVWLGANFDGPPKPPSRPQPEAPQGGEAVPKTLDWDQWLGPAPNRPYTRDLRPFSMALLVGLRQRHSRRFLLPLLRSGFLGFEAAASDDHRGRRAAAPRKHRAMDHRPRGVPGPRRTAAGRAHLVSRRRHPDWIKEKKIPLWGNAVLFVGADGMLIADYGRHQLLPEDKFKEYKRPAKTIADSIGHHAEWINACKTGGPTTCNFDYSGAFDRGGVVVQRGRANGKKLEWDAAALKATNCPEADRFLRQAYRPGWTL